MQDITGACLSPLWVLGISSYSKTLFTAHPCKKTKQMPNKKAPPKNPTHKPKSQQNQPTKKSRANTFKFKQSGLNDILKASSA